MPRPPERSSVLFALYERLDRRLFRQVPDALEPVGVAGELVEVPRLDARMPPGGGHHFRDEDVAAVRERSLDVLLWLGAARTAGTDSLCRSTWPVVAPPR